MVFCSCASLWDYRWFVGASPMWPSSTLRQFQIWLQPLRGFFLISGLFTSVAGAIIVLMQALLAFSPAFASDGERSIHLFLAAVGASVAMLGPGAWSVDARRFGRKVFEIGEPRHPRS